VGTILSTKEGFSSAIVFEVSEGGDDEDVEDTELVEPRILMIIFL
jgi:hypothetical protein